MLSSKYVSQSHKYSTKREYSAFILSGYKSHLQISHFEINLHTLKANLHTAICHLSGRFMATINREANHLEIL